MTHPGPHNKPTTGSNLATRRKPSVQRCGGTALCALLALVLVGFSAGCSSDSDNGKSTGFNGTMQGWLDKITGHGKKPLTYEAAQMFNSDDPDAQRAAIAYVSTQKFGHDKAYMKAYQLAATAPDPMVRGQALMALGTSGDPSIAPTLITGLSDPSNFVRMCAAIGLTHVMNPVAVAPLRDRLAADTDIQVRVYCAQALGMYHAQPVLRSLIDALDNRNVAVVQAAWDSLHRLTGQNLPQHPGPWRTWLKHSATGGMALKTGS